MQFIQNMRQPWVCGFLSALLLLESGPMAFAAHSYVACQNRRDNPDQLAAPIHGMAQNLVEEQRRQAELAVATAHELTQYLGQGQSDIQSLRAWLKPYLPRNSWPRFNAAECARIEPCLYLRATLENEAAGDSFPVQLANFRLALALSRPSDTGSWQLWKLDIAGNPRMQPPVGGPLTEAQEPLTAEESFRAQRLLDYFWDHHELKFTKADEAASFVTDRPVSRGTIPDYMRVIEEKIAGGSSDQARLRSLLKEFETVLQIRDFKTRIEKALLIRDQDWIRFRSARLEQFYHDNIQLLWSLVNFNRPLIYLKAARPTPADLDTAFAKSLADNRKLAAQVQEARAIVESSGPPTSTAIERLLDYPAFVESALIKRGELCATATRYRRSLDGTSAAAWNMVYLISVSPLLASGGASLMGLSLGRTTLAMLMAGLPLSELAATADAWSRYNHLRLLFKASRMNSNEGLISARNLRAARGEITAHATSLMLTSFTLGIGSLHVSTMKKLILLFK